MSTDSPKMQWPSSGHASKGRSALMISAVYHEAHPAWIGPWSLLNTYRRSSLAQMSASMQDGKASRRRRPPAERMTTSIPQRHAPYRWRAR